MSFFVVVVRARYLRNVSVESDMGKPNVEFTADGVLKSAELKIMNLRPGNNKQMLAWEEVGYASGSQPRGNVEKH